MTATRTPATPSGPSPLSQDRAGRRGSPIRPPLPTGPPLPGRVPYQTPTPPGSAPSTPSSAPLERDPALEPQRSRAPARVSCPRRTLPIMPVMQRSSGDGSPSHNGGALWSLGGALPRAAPSPLPSGQNPSEPVRLYQPPARAPPLEGTPPTLPRWRHFQGRRTRGPCPAAPRRTSAKTPSAPRGRPRRIPLFFRSGHRQPQNPVSGRTSATPTGAVS